MNNLIKKMKLMTLSFVALSSLCASSQAITKEELKTQLNGVNIDALLGVDFITGGKSSSSSNFSWGARIGYHFDSNWEFGAGYTRASNSTPVVIGSGQTYSNSSALNLFMIDGVYHLPQEWNPLYFGVRLGLGINSGSTTIPNAEVSSSTGVAYGLVAGYDFALGDSFSIGPRASYTMINQSDVSNIGDFQAQAALKYFF